LVNLFNRKIKEEFYFILLGSQLKMNIRALPSWRQKEGAHTEILLYETEGREGLQNDSKSVSKESNSKLK
jgi:hypothetical protein